MGFFHRISHLVILLTFTDVSTLNIQLEDKSGSKDAARHSDQPSSMVKPSEKIEEMIGAHAFEIQPFHWTSFFYAKGASMTKLRFVMCSVLCALLAMGLLLAPWKCWSSRSSESSEAHPDLAGVLEIGDGTWADTYRHANGERKEALELLFLCKIISAHEFAHSHTSEEHVEECVRIGIHMLRQKSSEEWVDWRQQALQSFEDSITAIFASRTTKGCGVKELLRSGHVKAETVEEPGTPPLQGVLKDLLILKGSFPSPVMSTRSNASTVQTTPVTPGRFPAQHYTTPQQAVPFDFEGINVTFDKQVPPEGPPHFGHHHLHHFGTTCVDLGELGKTRPHLSLSTLPPPTEPCLSGSSLDDRWLFRPPTQLLLN